MHYKRIKVSDADALIKIECGKMVKKVKWIRIWANRQMGKRKWRWGIWFGEWGWGMKIGEWGWGNGTWGLGNGKWKRKIRMEKWG